MQDSLPSSRYVPDGLTAAEYAAQKNAKSQKQVANKTRFPKGAPQMLDVADWLVDMEKKQTMLFQKNGNTKVDTTGHTFAKGKWGGDFTKEAYDKAQAEGKFGKKPAAPAKKAGGFKFW